MASQTQSPDHGFGTLFRFLVAYRLFVYLGGLVAIGIPLLLQRAYGTELSPGARTAIVVASLSLMIVTYIAERRVGRGHLDDRTGESTESYSLRLRASVATAVVGLAVGIYAIVEINVFTGVLFITGAFLFAFMGYRKEGTDV
jgi:energy-converting hydrogenase Eha subunit A